MTDELFFELVEFLEGVPDDEKYEQAILYLTNRDDVVSALVEEFFQNNMQTVGYLMDAKTYFSRVEPDTPSDEEEYTAPANASVVEEADEPVQEKESLKEKPAKTPKEKPLPNPFKKYIN